MKTAENVTMRDIATLREWAKAVPNGRKTYLRLAARAESDGHGGWAALSKIASLINQKKGPWS